MIKNIIYSVLLDCWLMLKASNIAFTLGCILAAVSNNVWPKLIFSELFSLNLLSIFYLIVNFAIIGLIFSISIFWCIYSQDSDCFVLNSYFFKTNLKSILVILQLLVIQIVIP